MNNNILTSTPETADHEAAALTATPTVIPAASEAEAKLVALTFDDGPNTVTTPLVLDKLEEYGIVASFFLCGNNVTETVRSVMERQLALGCELANHSWSHPAMSALSKEEIEKEIADTNSIIQEMVGVTPQFFRPPYIATSPEMYQYIDLPFICGIGCNDWDAAVSTEKRAEVIINTVKDGDIILLHDSVGNINTVNALDLIIPWLLDQGYQFVTVSKLFERKDVDPNVENVIWTNVKE